MLRSILSAALASALRLPLFGASEAPPVSTWSPADVYASGTTGIWLYGRDNTDLKVNADGTGGSVAEGGTIGRWNDRSGSGNYAIQNTASTRPKWLGGKVRFFHATNTTTRKATLARDPLTVSTPRQNCSGGFICTPNETSTGIIWRLSAADYSTLTAYVENSTFRYQESLQYNTSLPWTARKMVVTFRSNATNTIWNVNGTDFVGAPLSAASLTILSSLNNESMGLSELVIFNADRGASEIAQLRSYFRDAVGTYDATNVVALFGDSMTVGVGSEDGKPYHEYITNRAGSNWYAFGKSAGWIGDPHVSAAQMAALAGSTQTVYVVWIGVNDVALYGQTAANAHTNLANYCATLKAVPGAKVIVCTLPDIPAASRAVKDAYNALIVANYATYADAIVRLDLLLPDCTDTAKFTTDQIHLKDAGHADVGAAVQAVMASIP